MPSQNICVVCNTTGDEEKVWQCSRCKDRLYCGVYPILLLRACIHEHYQEGPVKSLTGKLTKPYVTKSRFGVTSIANVVTAVFMKENWSSLHGLARRKRPAGDIALLRNLMIFVESLRLNMVVTRLSYSSIGLKGLDGLAVEQMRGWIGDATIMVPAPSPVPVTFAGIVYVALHYSFIHLTLNTRMGKPLPNKIYNEKNASRF